MNRDQTDKDWLADFQLAHEPEFRDQMQHQFRSYHRRRRLTPMVVVPVLMVLALFSVWRLAPLAPVGIERKSPAGTELADSGESHRGTPVVPLEIESNSKPIEIGLINDSQLLDLLAEAGQPSVLVWKNGKKKVLSLTRP